MTFARSIVWMVGFTLMTAVAADAFAREATLKLQDGRKITGDLVAETADTVVLKVAGIETTFPREQITSMEVAKTLSEQFADERGKIKDDDYNARYNLARKMFETRTTEGYKLASRELDSILKASPDHQMAKLLKNVVTERLKLQPDEPETPDKPDRPAPQDPGDAPQVVAGDGPREITDEEINIIKVWETRLADKPNIVVPRKVLEELIEKYQGKVEMEPYRGRTGRSKLMQEDGYKQLELIFRLRAREYYEQVLVRTEPEYLTDFRQKINRQLAIGYCGQCHGEGKAKGFWVVTRPQNEQATMQNLLLLRTTKTSTGFTLVAPQNPVRSPLLQYAMPRDQAATPHPDVKGFQPYFRQGDKDFRYKATLDWITKSLHQDEGSYPGVDFSPPAGYGDEAPKRAAPAAEDAEAKPAAE